MRRIAVVVFIAAVIAALPSAAGAGAYRPRVLRVGTWHGAAGDYTSIAAAVAAAQPGDWILVAPGDYHERGSTEAGVLIDKPDVHIRGLDRNGVVIDGTNPGAPQCSNAASDQDQSGRNGIEAFEVSGVTIDNLTVCNYMTGPNGGGNEIWWNGGDGTGEQHLGSFGGNYLSATSTYWETGKPHGEYGIFVSNTTGPGVVRNTYASNMADAGYYVGACPDCNTVLDHAHAQYNALGYSGTNSGGHLVIKNSEFDNNKTGFSTNSQNNDDAPSPQDGACPRQQSAHHVRSCWMFVRNFVHDNNNANVPGTGTAELGPPGTGIVIAGGRFDTVKDNVFTNNDSWAVLVVPYVDTGTPPPIAHCEGGIDNWNGLGCFYAAWGNEVTGNRFANNGGYGNPTNGDLADLSDQQDPGNCWRANRDRAGVTSAPADLQQTNRVCGAPGAGEAVLGSDLSNQVLCATELLGPCDPSVGHYPRGGTVVMPALAPQTTMPNPCRGVPRNPWCR
jgi:hypothetical protein